ncbi:LLM class flavin-dependent oxidoreductase [Streptomyces sp. WAC04114]|nr:LLM class flavin-dependent oxidoreductase [Streptomyces sp. WAC04114]
MWRGRTVDLHGEPVRVEDAVPARGPDPVPESTFGGSSPIAGEIAARHADVYLTWDEPPAQVSEKIARLRSPGFGEGFLPRLAARGLWRRHPAGLKTAPSASAPFGPVAS